LARPADPGAIAGERGGSRPCATGLGPFGGGRVEPPGFGPRPATLAAAVAVVDNLHVSLHLRRPMKSLQSPCSPGHVPPTDRTQMPFWQSCRLPVTGASGRRRTHESGESAPGNPYEPENRRGRRPAKGRNKLTGRTHLPFWQSGNLRFLRVRRAIERVRPEAEAAGNAMHALALRAGIRVTTPRRRPPERLRCLEERPRLGSNGPGISHREACGMI
jgi:hypothetical protein